MKKEKEKEKEKLYAWPDARYPWLVLCCKGKTTGNTVL
jgi:hypothetical protein